MSGGVSLPRFTVTARQRPNVAVAAQGRPVVASVTVRGQQGAQGIQGAPGANGFAKRFGTIDYTDTDAGTPFMLPAGEWVRLTRNLTPSAANFNLPSGPWANFAFWDNAAGLLRARAVGDVLLFKFSYTVVPQQRGGGLRFSVRPGDDVNFEFGPDPIALTADAGQMQPGSETFAEQCRTRFVASGAVVYVMATSGGTLMEFSPEVTPLDFAS
ncbi:hypothetical protein [Methylobacterium sp. 1973]|uniref:hypothetical protein n=1 Tax=Methylobacterium sp. 1973 TaxID=3156421 RepID=UPI0033924039